MRRNLYFSYSLLAVYILIGVVQNQYLKKDIQKKRNHILELQELLIRNENKFTEIDIINYEYELIICTLDSLIKEKKHKSISRPNTTPKPDPTPDPDPIPEPDSTPDPDPILEPDLTPESNPILKTEPNPKPNYRPINNDLFLGITDIFSDSRNQRPIKTNDKYIWIELESEKGGYKNSLRSILKGIFINDTPTHISEIREGSKRTQSGIITLYYIKIQLPKRVLYQRNRIIISADRDYIQWFKL